MALPDRSRHDSNLIPTVTAVSSSDGETPVSLWADPVTHALVTSGGGGSGSSTLPVVSANNSTTATLTSGSVFTGTSEDITNYGMINVSVISDVASATDGLSLQQSSNGTNWDILDPYTVTANTGKVFSLPRQAKFFRVVYTNGGTNQASFRLQTIYTPNVTKGSSVRPADAISNENDLEQTANFGMLYNGSTWDRTRSIATGIQGVGINDGTTTANVAVVGTGQNALITGRGYKEVTGNLTGGTGNILTGVDVSAYSWASIQVTGTFSLTYGFRGSNDGATYSTVSFANAGSSILNPQSQSTATSSLFYGPLNFKFLQIPVTAYTSGTINVTVELYTIAPNSQTFGATVGATNATNATLPTSAFPMGINNNNLLVIPSGASTLLDAAAGSAIMGQQPYLFNGTTYDRIREVINATNSSGAGIPAAGILAQLDDVSPTSITENQFGNIRMAADRSLLVSDRSVTPTQTSVVGSATSVSILAANANRKGATITNDSTATLYVKLGTTASTTSYTVVLAGTTAAPFAYYEVPFGYIGAIDGIWASATGNARITELI